MARTDSSLTRNWQAMTLVGDVNGDGFDDILIGADGSDPNPLSGASAAYIIFGKATNGSKRDDILDASPFLQGDWRSRLQIFWSTESSCRKWWAGPPRPKCGPVCAGRVGNKVLAGYPIRQPLRQLEGGPRRQEALGECSSPALATGEAKRG
jgi:hypothetical protein